MADRHGVSWRRLLSEASVIVTGASSGFGETED